MVKWTDSSQVNPEYEAVAMEKAMRWAIPSAGEATEPVLTTLVLPWWDDKGSSYARWLSHQTVQAIATTDRSKFRFNAPRHWADEQDQWCTTKRNVDFLIVANEAGLQRVDLTSVSSTPQGSYFHTQTGGLAPARNQPVLSSKKFSPASQVKVKPLHS